MSKIILCGAKTADKAQLAADWCSQHGCYTHVKEVASYVIDQHNINRDDSHTVQPQVELVDLIFQEQNRREMESGSPSFIAEAGPDYLVHAFLSSKGRAIVASESRGVKECFARYRKSLVVFLCPLEKRADEGATSPLDNFTDALHQLLREFRIPYMCLDENDPAKIETLERAVNGTLPIPVCLEQFMDHMCLSFFLDTEKPLQTHHTYQLPLQGKEARVRTFEISKTAIVLKNKEMDNFDTNRMVDRYGEEEFVLIEFIRLPAGCVKQCLKQGVEVNGEMYQFIGSSVSGIKKTKCYLKKGSVEHIGTILSECGDFSGEKTVSKRLKRIALLFSVARDSGVAVPEGKFQVIDDIKSKDGKYNFTDGCGLIGDTLAEQVAKGANRHVESLEDNVPSVFQVRYQGCKGVVCKEPRIEANTIQVRKSMYKFKAGTKPFPNVWVCKTSRPYSYGMLNKQFIMLLSGLGIKDEVFLDKQKEYYIGIENMLTSSESAIIMLNWKNRTDIASRIASCTTIEELKQKEIMEPLRFVRHKLIEKLEKLQIPILNSRTVFGICDPRELLEYGECFIRITDSGSPRSLEPGTKIIVVKNPCYMLGDIRVLVTTDCPELHHLVDCIVFPVKGKRPHPDEIAGSDLDGDEYFVSWDADLIPEKPADPYEFPAADDPPCPGEITREMMIDYLADYSDNMGQIDGSFHYWAEVLGPNCTKCQRLGALFSRSVDASKTGEKIRLDRDLRKPKPDPENPSPDRPKRVWERMKELASARKDILKAEDGLKSEQSTPSESFILRLLCGKELGLSEYRLFRLLCKWCYALEMSESRMLEKLCALSDHINFGLFTLAQRKEAIDAGIPAEVVMNALNKSKLMSRDMLQWFSLALPACAWKFYIRAGGQELAWQDLLRALTGFPESMLILQLDLDVRVVIHFMGTLRQGDSILPPGFLSAYLYSPHMGQQLRYVSTTQYTLDLGDGIIQAFRGNVRKQTFIWFRRNKGDLYPKLSLDLTRFRRTILRVDNHPRISRQDVQSVEVFVKSRSNEDTAYFDILDSDQCGDLFTADWVSSENLEELPSDEEEESVFPVTEPVRLAPNEGLEKMTDYAEKGDCLQFSRIISGLDSDVMETITHSRLSEEVLALLNTLVVKFSHKIPSENFTEYLWNILKSPHVIFQTPQDLLLLYSSLNKLHLDKLTRDHLKTLHNSPFKLESIAQYIDCVSHFERWSFLPTYACRQLLNSLYLMNSELLAQQPEASDSASASNPYTIQDVVSMTDMSPSIDETQLLYYRCYFGFLMLKHLLAESPSPEEFRRDSDTDKSICMLKATNPPKDIRVDSKADGSCEEEEQPSGDVPAKKKKKENPQPRKVCFYRLHRFASNKFSEGSFVKIRHLTTPDSKHSQKPIALGRITRVVRRPGSNVITVDISEPVPECIKKSADLEVGYWSLTLLGNVTSFQRSCKALQRLHNSPDITPILISPEAFPPNALREEREDYELEPQEAIEVALAPQRQRIHKDGCKACEVRQRFNTSQENAIRAALSQRLTLIHGPPGTGKTCVASEIVHRMCHLNELGGEEMDKKEKILVAAETNNAADNLTRKLVHMGMRVVRVGSQVSPDIQQHTLDKLVRTRREELGEEARGEHLPPRLKKEILHSVDIVATTCTGAGDTDLKGIKFSFVLIDEATQAVEPVSLISIAKSCQKLVLIGDPKQLAPTISDQQQEECTEIPALKLLQETMFHRLRCQIRSSFLEKQYRMHPYIALFPSQQFYAGKLKSGVTEDERTPPDLKFLDMDRPVVFIDVESQERSTYASHRNEKEAEVIVDVIKELNYVKGADFLVNIAVLTPYVGQDRCIKEKLENESLKVEVCTVDSFQGKEKDVIVFSTVRSNEQGQLGFTDSEHRINVLLTRAKIALIGVGNVKTLVHSKIWNDWLDENIVITKEKFYELIISGDVKRTAETDQPRPDKHSKKRSTDDHYSNRIARSRMSSSRRATLGDYYQSGRQHNAQPRVYVSNSPKRSSVADRREVDDEDVGPKFGRFRIDDKR